MYSLRQKRFAFSFIVVFILANVFWNLVFRSNQHIVDWGGVTFQIIACLVSIGWLMSAFLKHMGAGKSFWLFLALGVLCYLIGTLIWSLNEFVLPVDSELSNVPEKFWIGQNGFYFIALLVVMDKIKSHLLTIRFFLDLLIVMSSAITFSWIFLIYPLVNQNKELILISTELIYPILDLGVLVGIFSFFAASNSIFSKKVTILLVTGLVIQVVADTIFSYLQAMNTYSVGSINEPLWLFSLLLIGLSGVYHVPFTTKQFTVHHSKQGESLFFKLSIPHLSVILLSLYAIFLLYQTHPIVIGLFLCVVLVILRQIITLLENEKLMKQLNVLNEELEVKVKERTDKLVETVNSMEHLAYHDVVTGLPNRRFMEKRLSQAINHSDDESESKIAFILLDLDRFKHINDSLGHSYGDLLLQEVGKRLTDSLKANEIACRIGGDEYGLLLENTNKEEIEEKASAILEALRKTYYIKEFDIDITPSIGISIFPDHGRDLDALLMKADTAMYQVKEFGKNHYKIYNCSMSMKPMMNLESSLRKGLERNEFILYYQPQISLDTGKVVGVEALLRWNRPKYGIIAPAEFISFAEETGLILPIGERVLREACKQSVFWRKKGFSTLRIAVNISPLQFQRDDFIEMISEMVKETGTSPNQIELEITESVAMGSVEKNLAKMSFLKQMGFHIAMDDFGTGYSSLHYLSQFQIDRLKIDRSFISALEKGERNEAIVKLIVMMAKGLNFKVLAEGVEKESQKKFLKEIGCDEMQGFLFSPPLSAEECEMFMLSKSRQKD